MHVMDTHFCGGEHRTTDSADDFYKYQINNYI